MRVHSRRMIAAKVRELFEKTIPEELARRRPLREGFRCRFHIGDAGAWEIDLRRDARCVDARTALGGYHAVVYASAEDFWSLTLPEGENLEELVASGKLRTTGDTARALEMTTIVAKGPPFLWSPELRVSPVGAAFFAATEDDVVQAFPGWRTALPAPVIRQVKNPFTGQLVEVPSHDPHPDEDEESTFAPLAPPFPFVFAPTSSEWWDDLLDFHLALVRGDREARRVREDTSLELWEMTDRVFPPLFAGRSGRSNVYAMPRSLATALAQLSDEEGNVLAAKLATHLYRDASRPNPFTGVPQDYSEHRDAFERNARRSFREARELAKNLSSQDALWFWGWFE